MLETLEDCIEALIRIAKRSKVDPDLLMARQIAADQSKQTGKNYQNFTSGKYDHAFGVQCVLRGIKYGRETS